MLAALVLAAGVPTSHDAGAIGPSEALTGGSATGARADRDVSPWVVSSPSGYVQYNPGTSARKRWKRARRTRG